MILFLVVERKAKFPMIDLSLFTSTIFSVNLSTGFIVFVANAGIILLIPFYLENILGYTTRSVGLLMAVVPVSLGIVAPIAGNLSDRFGSRPLSFLGLVLLALSYLGISTLSVHTSTVGYILRFLPVGIGMGLFQSPNNSAVMGAVSRERLGIASGLLSLTRTLGQTAGISLIGAFWSYRVNLLAGNDISDGATSAASIIQVSALSSTSILVSILLFLAAGLSLVTLLREKSLSSNH
jgi:MFS family permease